MSPKNIKKGVLLVNLGTPDSPSVADVRRYLREFLMDERVIDIPYIQRWLLINLIITTFRSPKSAKEYQKLWDEKGSPLKYYGEEVTESLQNKLEEHLSTVQDQVAKLLKDFTVESNNQIQDRFNTWNNQTSNYTSAMTSAIELSALFEGAMVAWWPCWWVDLWEVHCSSGSGGWQFFWT